MSAEFNSEVERLMRAAEGRIKVAREAQELNDPAWIEDLRKAHKHLDEAIWEATRRG